MDKYDFMSVISDTFEECESEEEIEIRSQQMIETIKHIANLHKGYFNINK